MCIKHACGEHVFDKRMCSIDMCRKLVILLVLPKRLTSSMGVRSCDDTSETFLDDLEIYQINI